MDWTDQHYRAFHRLMRRRTLYAEMVASAARVELNPLRFVQTHEIILDHFGSGISCDQTCKWGIEWDTCASIYLKEESYLEASF